MPSSSSQTTGEAHGGLHTAQLVGLWQRLRLLVITQLWTAYLLNCVEVAD